MRAKRRGMKSDKDRTKPDKSIQDKLAKKYACYVLVTCNEPSDDGDIQVEMTYHGDASLAALLLHGAQSYMDEEHEALGVE